MFFLDTIGDFCPYFLSTIRGPLTRDRRTRAGKEEAQGLGTRACVHLGEHMLVGCGGEGYISIL